MVLARFAGRLTGLEWTATAAVGGIAVATFATSFSALTDLARQSEALTPELAPMLPVAVDGMIVAASLAVVTARRAGRSARYSWTLVGLYTAVSVVGNAVHALGTVQPGGALAAVIAAIFPLTLFLAFEQLLAILGHHRQTAMPLDSARVTSPGASAGRPELAQADPRAAALSPGLPSGVAESDPGLRTEVPVLDPGLALEAPGAPGDGPGLADAGTARDRVQRLLDEHLAAGGDVDGLSPSQVATSAGCSERWARRLLAQLRADLAPATAAGNGHHQD